MSMSKPVHPDMATATPLGPPGARRRRSSTPGCSSWTRNHPPPESVFPTARHGRSLPRVRPACIPDTYAASGPNRERWKNPDPRRRSNRGSGRLRISVPARQWRLRMWAVPSQRPPGARRDLEGCLRHRVWCSVC